MALSKSSVSFVFAALLASGCAHESNQFTAADQQTQQVQPQAPAQQQGGQSDVVLADAPPALGQTNFSAVEVSSGVSTGTKVGQKVQSLRQELMQLQRTIEQRNAELQDLRQKTAADAAGYHTNVASMNSRLQIGTTPGNPIMTESWRQAQGQLESLNMDIAGMNQLATVVAADSAMSAYLLDSVRATRNLSGAVDEDHAQLQVLEDETNRTVVTIERLLNELSRDITRQQQYVSREVANLNTLAIAVKNGHLYGASLANSTSMGVPVTADNLARLPTPATQGRQPLVVIKFDRPNVRYEQALYDAVSAALKQVPSATFELVAVSPNAGGAGRQALAANTARRNAENVLRSLTDMGMPSERIRFSGQTSNSAETSEVHLYVR
jgi:molecular chaperone GrpE (heat shock protein)